MMIWPADEQEERAPLRAGVLHLGVQDLESALHLPKEYRITGVYYDPANRAFKLVLSSDVLAEVPEHAALPGLSLWVTVHHLPEHPEYRRYEIEVKAL